MKKNLLLSLFVLFSADVMADDVVVVNIKADDVVTLDDAIEVVAGQSVLESSEADVDDVDLSGTYLVKTDRLNSSGTYQASYSVSVDKTAEGYSITGLLGRTGTVTGTYNASNKTIVVKSHQVVYTHPTYGDCAIIPYKGSSNYTTFTLYCDVDAGILSMTNMDGLKLSNETPYEGKTYYIGYKEEKLSLCKSNGNIYSELVDGSLNPIDPTSYFTAVVVDKENKSGYICGIDNITYQTFSYLDDGTVTFVQEPAYIYNSEYTKPVWCKAILKDTGTYGFYPKLAPVATIDLDNGKIEMAPWAFVMSKDAESAYSFLNGRKAKSTITFTLPVPTSIDNAIVDNTKVTSVRKIAENGRVYIQKGDARYSLQGARIK